jgi:hypothetical protein
MTIPFSVVQPLPDLPLVNPRDGRPTLPWAQYLPRLQSVVAQLAAGQPGELINAANDAAAARAGVAVGATYRNGSQLMIRVS